jgi:uncharacterized protein YfdQ (DUF2303 family)
MSGWLYKIRNDINEIVSAIDYYENQINEARSEILINGNVERHARDMPGVIEYRFYQLQEMESILEYLNIELRKKRSHIFRKYLEHYNKQLSSRDAEKYTDGEQEIVDMQHLINEFSLVRNTMLGVIKALEQKSFSVNNIIKLRGAGLEDISL